VAWVPLAPREVYYGRGHHGPHSVDITTINVTNVHVDKVVYKNVRVNNAVTTVDHNTFVRGRPADAQLKENPFLTEKVHVGRPPLKPEKTSAKPVVREVPQTKKPPEPVRQLDVRELKERRPMAKSKEASVFRQETRPGQMPVKEGEAKPLQKKSDRVKELRQPSKRTAQPGPSAPEKQVGQPTPSGTKVETQKERGKSERSLERTGPTDPAPTKAQEQKQRVPTDKRSGQPAPSEPPLRTPKEAKTPARGTDRRIESRSPERVIEQTRPPERVRQESKEVSPPEKVIPQATDPRAPDKRTEGSRGPRSSEKGA